MRNIFEHLTAGELARRHPLRYVDIGSRGGFQEDLHPLAFAVDATGFEPDPAAFAALQSLPADPWKSAAYLPYALSDSGGTRTLYIPRDPIAASLLRHDASLGTRFNKQHLFEIAREETVETKSLEDAVREAGLSGIDYLKIDVEGAELSILEAAPKVIDGLLALKTEVAFVPPRVGQPLAFDIANFMQAQGFELMTMLDPMHWRRDGDLIDPYYGPGQPAYARGQLIHADFLFMRPPEAVGDDPARAVRLALMYMALGYFDHALMTFEDAPVRAYLERTLGCTPLEVVAPASKAYGRRRFVQAFRRQARGLVPFLRYLKNLFG